MQYFFDWSALPFRLKEGVDSNGSNLPAKAKTRALAGRQILNLKS